MQHLLEQFSETLKSVDITIHIAKDNDIFTLALVPKIKAGEDKSYPPMTVSGTIDKFSDKGIEFIASKLKAELPGLFNVSALNNAIKKAEEEAKAKIEKKKAAKPAQSSKNQELFKEEENENEEE